MGRAGGAPCGKRDCPSGVREVEYLNRETRCTESMATWDADPTHLDHMRRESGMQKCSAAPISITKGTSERARARPERSRSARRSVAILSYLAQDRPDLSAAARILSQQMSKPTEVIEVVVQSVIWYAQTCPRAAVRVGSGGELGQHRPTCQTDNCQVWLAAGVSLLRTCRSEQYSGSRGLKLERSSRGHRSNIEEDRLRLFLWERTRGE